MLSKHHAFRLYHATQFLFVGKIDETFCRLVVRYVDVMCTDPIVVIISGENSLTVCERG